MVSVFTLAPGEDWVCDRIVSEWRQGNPDLDCANPNEASVIWCYADWCWRRLPFLIRNYKKVLTTVHHIVPDKFGDAERADFAERDAVTDAYHVYNRHTEAFVRALTTKPIHLLPYWANQRLWRLTGTKGDLRTKHGLPANGYLIGSFQRDTEGHDLRSPKLEKGPDLLCDYLEGLSVPNVRVVLAGWRRQYVTERLRKAGITYVFFDRPSRETVNELYQTLDLYPVTARHEGGPQALIEAGLLGVPVVSRDVGIASQVLPPSAINNDVSKAIAAVPCVKHMELPGGFEPYRQLFREMMT